MLQVVTYLYKMNLGKQIIQNLITGATPLKYGKFLFDKTKEKLGGTDDNDEDEISKLIYSKIKKHLI